MRPAEAWAELRELAERTLSDPTIHMEGWWLAVWPFRKTAAKVLAEKIAKEQPESAAKAAELASLVTF
jgi:hypothetical protein